MSPIEKVINYLVEHDLDGVLLRKRNNFSWLTGGSANHIVLSDPNGVSDFLIFRDKTYLITTSMEEKRILEEECSNVSFAFELISANWMEGTDSIIRNLISNKSVVTDSQFDELKNVDADLIRLRAALSKEEIVNYKEICQTTAFAIEKTGKEIKPGMTEHEIAAALQTNVLEKGLNVHVALVATDERIFKYRHPIPTYKKLRNYAMLGICAEKGGLVANCTRFVHFGELPDNLVRIREKLARIDVTMNLATKPGVQVGEVIQAGIDAYAEQGYKDEWRYLHMGGLTGYNTREIIGTPESNHLVRVNEAYAWNPALPGVKSEDTMLVQEDHIEFLTHTGDWEYITVEVDGKKYERPTILVRYVGE